VVCSTEGGPHMKTWPDSGMTPFRSEKKPTRRTPSGRPNSCADPGHVPARVVSNEIIQHHDWLLTFLAAAGDPDVAESSTKGRRRARQEEGAPLASTPWPRRWHP
jgi:arylsulfatase